MMATFRTVRVPASVIAILLFGASFGKSSTENEDTTVLGTFNRHSDQKLEMTDVQGRNHSMLLSLELRVICDGEESTISDLKSGMKIRVTTLKSDKMVATEIEALDKQQSFGNTQDGTLASLTNKRISILDVNGQDHIYTLSDTVVIILNGVAVKPEDLKKGMKVRVTTALHHKSIATRIQAMREMPDF